MAAIAADRNSVRAAATMVGTGMVMVTARAAVAVATATMIVSVAAATMKTTAATAPVGGHKQQLTKYREENVVAKATAAVRRR